MSKASTALLSVSELTYQIKNQLEGQFCNLHVQGEITNCKLNTSGHLYFDLKDNQAKIAAVMFRGKNVKLPRIPKEGDHVVIQGTLSIYPPQGKYQLIVEALEFQGVGQLLLKLEELKKKLKERGWFDPEHKKKLPPFPQKIGVVTSPTGAVIQDILHILSRRYKGFHLILNPVKVQGDRAAQEISQAIVQFNQFNLVDVIIVGRGGGSLEDLWAFNEESVAAAIYNSNIPIISAVGHETDFTIADFVADVRAPTPSAAAEIVTAEKLSHFQFLEKMKKGANQALAHLVKRYKTHLQGIIRHPLLSNPYLIVGTLMQKLDEMAKKIDFTMAGALKEKKHFLVAKKKELFALKPHSKIALLRKELTQYGKRLDQLEKNFLALQRKKMINVRDHLLSLDPKNVLKRGYSILFAQKNHSVIVSTTGVHSRDEVVALVADGKIRLSVLDE